MDSTLSSIMTQSFSQIKTDIVAGLVIVIPIALAILSIFLVWKYGLKMFRHTTK